MKKNIKGCISVDLSNKVAVVTGGTGSIGMEIAKALFNSGAIVITVSRRGHVIGAAPKAKNFYFEQVNITEEENVRKLSDRILKRHKKIDILVLAHGIQCRKPFSEFSFDEWQNVIDTNLTGTFLACKHFARSMIERRYGKIIGISSLTSDFGIRNISAYAASKGGMSQFLKSMAVEVAKYNINVNMIAPGRIKTKMTEELLKNKSVSESNLRCIPMRRFGALPDLTGAALFLASKSSDYMTGQAICVDGGWSCAIGNPAD